MPKLDSRRLAELREIATRVRVNILRSVHHAQGGHIGGPLSATDLLTGLYFEILRIDPAKPRWEDRDRFILSKGHSAIALYAVMAERGYFPVAELQSFDAIDSRLQGHPDMNMTPGVDMSSGSLGQGLSPAIGIAIGAKRLGKDFCTYVMIGDGETQEGQIWEAAFIAQRYQLDNLVGILDDNKFQQYGWNRPTILAPIENPVTKFQAFGWHTIEIDGHDFQAILDACDEAKTIKGMPTMIIAHTIKGKGVSFMENTYQWHAQVPTDEELTRAVAELTSRG
jgi:transketolase